MSLRGWNQQSINDLRGSWSRLDGTRRRLPNRAFYAQNVRYDSGRVLIRHGFTPSVALVSGKVTSLHDWMAEPLYQVLFSEEQSPGTIAVRAFSKVNFALPPATYYAVLGARAAVATEAGTSMYVAHFNVAMGGVGQARVFTVPASGTPVVDIAFAPPWTASPTITDLGAGAGRVTAGTHWFGYIVETRSGFSGKPSPQPGDVFTPTAFTVPPGGHTLTMTIPVTVPADAVHIHPLMTRADNPDRWYFVPGADAVVTPGQVNPIFVIQTSDEDLAASGEDASDYFQALAQTVAGTGPISPSYVFNYGSRLGWIENDRVYFSDPEDPQFITREFHSRQVPGKRRLIAGCQLRGSAYLFGPDYTYEFSDNGDIPRNWPRANLVSGSIGTDCAFGIDWRTSGDYVWVAHRSGLYQFNGQYAPRPISYYNEREWNLINWSAPYAIVVADDPLRQRVLVAVPIGANEATRIYCWSYARGYEPEKVDFSDWNYAGGIQFGAIGFIRDPLSQAHTLLIPPAQSGSVAKEDASALTDGGAVILAAWESGFVLSGAGRKKLNRFGGIDVSLRGGGGMHYDILGPHHLRATAGEIQMSPDPGEEPQHKFDIVEEDVTVRFFISDLNEWFDVSGFTVHHKPYATNRT